MVYMCKVSLVKDTKIYLQIQVYFSTCQCPPLPGWLGVMVHTILSHVCVTPPPPPTLCERLGVMVQVIPSPVSVTPSYDGWCL